MIQGVKRLLTGLQFDFSNNWYSLVGETWLKIMKKSKFVSRGLCRIRESLIRFALPLSLPVDCQTAAAPASAVYYLVFECLRS